jgi:hypothetical protein
MITIDNVFFCFFPTPASHSPIMSSTSTIPRWLESLYQLEHLNRVIDVLSKRERSREVARGQSRRQAMAVASGSKTRRLSNAVSVALPKAIGGASSAKPDALEFYAVTAGCQPENMRANRYRDLEPYDRTRVLVVDGHNTRGHLDRGGNAGAEGSDGRYINANWVRELNGGKWWIATQAPLPNTVHAFLSIILQPVARPPSSLHEAEYVSRTTRVRTVVQLTPNIERGLRKGVYSRILYRWDWQFISTECSFLS